MLRGDKGRGHASTRATCDDNGRKMRSRRVVTDASLDGASCTGVLMGVCICNGAHCVTLGPFVTVSRLCLCFFPPLRKALMRFRACDVLLLIFSLEISWPQSFAQLAFLRNKARTCAAATRITLRHWMQQELRHFLFDNAVASLCLFDAVSSRECVVAAIFLGNGDRHLDGVACYWYGAVARSGLLWYAFSSISWT